MLLIMLVSVLDMVTIVVMKVVRQICNHVISLKKSELKTVVLGQLCYGVFPFFNETC